MDPEPEEYFRPGLFREEIEPEQYFVPELFEEPIEETSDDEEMAGHLPQFHEINSLADSVHDFIAELEVQFQ